MVDLSFLKTFTKDDPEKIKRYIKLYLHVAPQAFSEMKQYLIEKDWEQLRIQAHSLKPQVEFMGIKSLKEELIKIEEAAKLKTPIGIEKLVEHAYTLYVESERELRKIEKNVL